jgi:hypothetical protein
MCVGVDDGRSRFPREGNTPTESALAAAGGDVNVSSFRPRTCGVSAATVRSPFTGFAASAPPECQTFNQAKCDNVSVT